jgi:hypothetical protein
LTDDTSTLSDTDPHQILLPKKVPNVMWIQSLAIQVIETVESVSQLETRVLTKVSSEAFNYDFSLSNQSKKLPEQPCSLLVKHLLGSN